MERVELGRTGIRVSRLAFGTGTNGFGGKSDQTALGVEPLSALLCYAQERGVRFWDTADSYGSHPHVCHALRTTPREEVVLLSKTGSRDEAAAVADVERFCRELRTDYLDVVLLHCMTASDWPTTHAGAMRGLEKVRERGLVRAVGVSCHHFGALSVAAEHPWVQVVMARFNHAGRNMDAPPDEVLPVLRRAHANGKGIFGMKPLAKGLLAEDADAALRFVFGQGIFHAVSIGMVNRAQVDENVALAARYAKAVA
ncbi:MAG: aldo/keto reductase [Armatimonadota bacterium]|jgi:aryl-alcohol dehydrogenase-like predicted oxidoreductase|nr:aldo/keto reductase [Armatimonadota bacterium]